MYLISPGYPASPPCTLWLPTPPFGQQGQLQDHMSLLHLAEQPCTSFWLLPFPLTRSSPLLWFGGSQRSRCWETDKTHRGLLGKSPPVTDQAMDLSQGSSWDSGLSPGKHLGTNSKMSVRIRKPQTQCSTPMNPASLLHLRKSPRLPCCCLSPHSLPAFPDQNTSYLSLLDHTQLISNSV